MTVSSQIIEVLNELCKKFGIVIDWSAENIMPYLKELCGKFINYEIYTSIAWMILILVICIVFWIIFAATLKRAKEEEWDDETFVCIVNVVSGFFAVVLSITSALVIGVQIFDIIEAIYLPEKTIYEYIQHLISLHN